jgi:hypothetical protein
MHSRPRLIMTTFFVLGLLAHVAIQPVAGFSDRAPRVLTISVVVIGLHWGTIAGALAGALGGFILALFAGEPPFAATAAMAAAGGLAGEIPTRFVLETYRAIALAAMAAVVFEIVLVSLLRGILLPNILNLLIWAAGWAALLGVLLYWLAAWLSTAPTTPRLTDDMMGKE